MLQLVHHRCIYRLYLTRFRLERVYNPNKLSLRAYVAQIPDTKHGSFEGIEYGVRPDHFVWLESTTPGREVEDAWRQFHRLFTQQVIQMRLTERSKLPLLYRVK